MVGNKKNKKAIEELTKQSGFGKDKPYWDGTADNEYHLYKVVHTVNS